MQFQDELAGGIVLVRPALRSPNYVAGTSGWNIAIDGSAEFNNVTVRGTLQSSNYVAGVSGWKLNLSGTAELNELTARGTVQSSNYVAGTSGWQINNSGSAEFDQLTARGTVQSSNYVTGSTGWQINDSGSAEFNDVAIRGGTNTQGLWLMYSGTPAAGNLIGSIARLDGTDSFGNDYSAGISMLNPAGNSYARLTTNGGVMFGDDDEWDLPASLSVGPPTADFGTATLLNSARNEVGTTYDRAAGLILEPGDSSPARNAQAIIDSPATTTSCDLTVTGGVTAQAGLTVTGLSALVERAAAGDTAFRSRVTGDSNSRFLVETGGRILWSSGAASGDTNLYRAGASLLATDDDFSVGGSITADNLRRGTAQAPAPGGSPAQTSVSVTFANAMNGTPAVVATPNSSSADLNNANIRWAVTSVSSTGFTINCWRDTNAATNFEYVAIAA